MSSLWSRVSGHSNSRVFIFISSQVAMKMVGHWSGDHRTLSLLLCLLSMVSGQVAEVSSDTSGYVDTVAEGGYYSGNGYVYSGYQSEPGVQTSADTDRYYTIIRIYSLCLLAYLLLPLSTLSTISIKTQSQCITGLWKYLRASSLQSWWSQPSSPH